MASNLSSPHDQPKEYEGIANFSSNISQNIQVPTQIHSDLLLQGAKLLHIVHNGQTYQLRATRLGKLILTK